MKTIKSKQEFEKVFSSGSRANHPLVRITYLKTDKTGGKVAFVAAKRLGNAVYRNRCKRLLREAARMSGLPDTGWSVILFSTNKTHESAPDEIATALGKLLRRSGVRNTA